MRYIARKRGEDEEKWESLALSTTSIMKSFPINTAPRQARSSGARWPEEYIREQFLMDGDMF